MGPKLEKVLERFELGVPEVCVPLVSVGAVTVVAIANGFDDEDDFLRQDGLASGFGSVTFTRISSATSDIDQSPSRAAVSYIFATYPVTLVPAVGPSGSRFTEVRAWCAKSLCSACQRRRS